jgi:CRISPR/Cas system-associated exonuclease Cas4 (RecB family)
MKIEHISASQINTYLRCPMTWKYRYMDGLIIPPRAALTRGKAVHSGCEFNYRQKIESRKDLPLNDVKNFTAAAFDEMRPETEWGEDKPDKVLDETVKLSELYHLKVAPKVQPVAVEEEIHINFDNADYFLKGYMDVVDEKGIIRDTKTSKRSPGENVIHTNLQLVAYALAYRQMYGKDEKGIAMDYLISTKEPKLEQYSTFVVPDRINNFLTIMAFIVDNIENDRFYQNPTNSLCSPKLCGYFQKCFGGREI